MIKLPAQDCIYETSLVSGSFGQMERAECSDATCKSSESGTEPENLLTAGTAESAGTQKRVFVFFFTKEVFHVRFSTHSIRILKE